MTEERGRFQSMFGGAIMRANPTGLPDRLKAGVESLSGLPLDHVRVHFNSSRPASIGAAAYTQGTDIHVAPGQERHLAHEAWHVVQQAQGRVRPTRQFAQGIPINDDDGLEREATVMGARAAGGYPGSVDVGRRPWDAHASPPPPMQFGPTEVNAWRRARGYNNRMAFIDRLVELFDGASGGAPEAWALILEHNDVADHHLHTIKPADVPNYQEPADARVRGELRRLAQARTYFQHEPVAPGDLVYGVGEARDPYVQSGPPQAFNVIDELNALFLGTRAGETYHAGDIPAAPGNRGQRAGEFRDFLNTLGPKDPQRTPGGDAFSINTRLRRASKYGIAFTAGRGNRIRFALDRLNQDEVARKRRPDDTGSTATGDKMRAITGSELRYIYRRRRDPAFMAAIEFYRDGHKLDAAPWEENPQIWAAYSPRQERSARWQIIRNVEMNVHNVLNSLPNRWRFALRPFGRDYVNTFIARFDAMFAGQDLDATGEQIIQGAYQHFITRIQALRT